MKPRYYTAQELMSLPHSDVYELDNPITHTALKKQLFLAQTNLKEYPYKREQYKRIYQILFKAPFQQVPLYVNDDDYWVPKIAAWRLKVGR